MIIKQLDSRNRIVLPPEILKKLNAKEGDYLILKPKSGRIEVVKANISESTD